MTEQQTAQLIALVKLRYPSAKLGQESADPQKAIAGMVRVWHMTLGDVPYEAAERALQQWFKVQKWAPDPSELRAAVAGELLGLPEVEEAWREARLAMRSYYPGQPFTAQVTPAVKRAIDAIGGVHALMASEHPAKDREAFQRAYALERRKELERAVLDGPALREPLAAALARRTGTTAD